MNYSKYKAKPCWVDGHRFPSKKEAARYSELKLLQKSGVIRNLTLQVPFELRTSNHGLVGKYIADFVYVWGEEKIVEDCKGFKTDLYKWKKKHFENQYNKKIYET